MAAGKQVLCRGTRVGGARSFSWTNAVRARGRPGGVLVAGLLYGCGTGVVSGVANGLENRARTINTPCNAAEIRKKVYEE